MLLGYDRGLSPECRTEGIKNKGSESQMLLSQQPERQFALRQGTRMVSALCPAEPPKTSPLVQRVCCDVLSQCLLSLCKYAKVEFVWWAQSSDGRTVDLPSVQFAAQNCVQRDVRGRFQVYYLTFCDYFKTRR